jgi:hypothetical protein
MLSPKQSAEAALATILTAIVETVEAAPEGLGNSEVARLLGLESDLLSYRARRP